MASPIYARSSDNILLGAAITSTVAPLTGYSLTTLALMDPAARVLWNVGTVTVTFTLGGSALGDVLCIPMHNLDAGGSPTVLTLTNGAGFSAQITVPEYQVDGYPQTLVVDLSTFAGTRTSNVWNLVITSNSNDVVLGGAVAIYSPLRTFGDLSSNSEGSFVGAIKEHYESREEEATNEYGSRYVQEYDWTDRQLEWMVVGPNSGVVLARDWYLANRGRARPSLLWPYPNEPDLGALRPMFGTWQKRFSLEVLTVGDMQFSAIMDEWPKGQVIP